MIYQNFIGLLKQHPLDLNSDLVRFVDLYRSFRIDCKISDCDEGFKIVLLTDGSYSIPTDVYTMDKKIEGFLGSTSGIIFNKEGMFLKQGIW